MRKISIFGFDVTFVSLFSLSLLFMFVLVSCTSGGYRPRNYQDTNYYTGTEGVNVEFMDNSPPRQVRENTQFPVALILKNQGAFSLNSSFYGVLSFGYDKFYFEESSSAQPSTVLGTNLSEWQFLVLEGKSPIFPDGGSMYKFLPTLKTKQINSQRQSPESEIVASVCYPYQTFLSERVCIDTYSIDDIREKNCEVEKHTYSGQGAPLVITKLSYELQNYGGVSKPVFYMTIKNMGKGSVMAPDKNCVVQAQYKNDWGKILVSASLGGEPLVCNPSPVALRDNGAQVRCDLNSLGFNANLNYYTNLDVKISYTYLTIVSKKVEITRDVIQRPNINITNKCNNSWEVSIGNDCVDVCSACASGFISCGQYFKSHNWSCVDNKTIYKPNTKMNTTPYGNVFYSDCIYDQGYCGTGFACCSVCEDVTYCGSYKEKSACNDNLCKKNTKSVCAWSSEESGNCHACGSEPKTKNCMEYKDSETCKNNPCDYAPCTWNNNLCVN